MRLKYFRSRDLQYYYSSPWRPDNNSGGLKRHYRTKSSVSEADVTVDVAVGCEGAESIFLSLIEEYELECVVGAELGVQSGSWVGKLGPYAA